MSAPPHPRQICQNSTSTNGHAELSGCAHQMSGPESAPLTLIGDAGLVWYKDARCDSQGDFNPCRLCPMDFGYINLTALSSSHLSLLRAKHHIGPASPNKCEGRGGNAGTSIG